MTLERFIDHCTARGLEPKRCGSSWKMHSPLRDEKTGSLDFKLKNGRIVLYDHGDTSARESDICAALGLAFSDLFPDGQPDPKILASYDYVDENNVLLYQIRRFHPKQFVAAAPNGKAGFRSGPGCMNGVRRVLYNLPAVLAATDTVWVVEGEKDANSLISRGLTATSAPFGAGKWERQYAEFLRNKDVVVIADNDEPNAKGIRPGTEHALQVLTSSNLLARSLKLIEKLPLPGGKFAKDVSDWLEVGMDAGLLRTLAEDAAMWTPTNSTVSAEESHDAQASKWSDPKDLESELPPVPDFDLNNLPAALQPLVQEVSEGMQVPFDFPACATIASLAGCVGHRALVLPKALDSSWQEVCNLWGMNIGNPGLMKSPILKLITRPLDSIQREWSEIQKADEATHEDLEQTIKLEQEVWQSQYKAALKLGRPLPPKPDDTLWKPGERRLLITDVTYECLHQIQSANPGGVFQLRDELIGFFCCLERDGREGERQYWLQCWNGNGGFNVDRIGRGAIYVPYVCASLFGNTVPARLRYYLTSVLSGAPTDDGFLPRFQVMCWPDVGTDWKYVDRVNSNAAANMAEQVYRSLVRLSGKYPLQLRFNAESQKLFVAWLTDLEVKLRSDMLNPVMAGHVSKYRKLMPVLAGIFELADCARRGELQTKAIPEPTYSTYARRIVFEDSPPTESSDATLISTTNTLRAIALCDYFERHAARVYSCIITPEIRAGHALARRIKKGDLEAQFSSRDVSRKSWSDLNTPELITAALLHLTDLFWIRPLKLPPSPQGGRPSELFEINPKIGNGGTK
jgi:hypothetical protein